MTHTDRVKRYLVLVNKLQLLEDEMKLLQHQVQIAMEAMTEIEEQQAIAKLGRSHGTGIIQALARHMEQRRAPPVE